MSDPKDRLAAENPADVLLQQLLHLKKYERPETARMTRNKQNIMRQVREASRQKSWSLGDLLEVNIPWFFAEPRYGIALLFIAFAGLQFWGASSRTPTGIYMPVSTVATYGQSSSIATTNSISYPELPGKNFQLFPDTPQGDSSVKFVGRLEEQK